MMPIKNTLSHIWPEVNPNLYNSPLNTRDMSQLNKFCITIKESEKVSALKKIHKKVTNVKVNNPLKSLMLKEASLLIEKNHEVRL